MKKILICCVALFAAFTSNAQSVQIMRDGQLFAEFYGKDGWEIIFKEEPTDPFNGHEYVDLGLPSGTLWATCNVGADKPEDYGLYFAWGETEGYTSDTSDGRSFDWESYKWWIGIGYNVTKYCTDSDYGIVDNKTELDLEDDAAHINWGGNWRMPSHEQLEELSIYATTTWTAVNDVYGRLITSNINGNTLFLPATGFRVDNRFECGGSDGHYWSRSLAESSSAWSRSFDSNGFGGGADGRNIGRAVRPVCSASE